MPVSITIYLPASILPVFYVYKFPHILQLLYAHSNLKEKIGTSAAQNWANSHCGNSRNFQPKTFYLLQLLIPSCEPGQTLNKNVPVSIIRIFSCVHIPTYKNYCLLTVICKKKNSKFCSQKRTNFHPGSSRKFQPNGELSN